MKISCFLALFNGFEDLLEVIFCFAFSCTLAPILIVLI